MLPDQIGTKASQRGKESCFSFLSQCAGGILRFLSQEINTHIIAYGIFTHTAYSPILYAISHRRVLFYLFIYKGYTYQYVTLFILTVPSSLTVTSFQRSSVRIGTVIKINFISLTKLYCLRYTHVFHELHLLDYFVRN